MREKLYEIIKSPTEGNPETTLYDYFMMVVIILSLLPLTYKLEAEPYWVIYVEHIAVTVFIIDYLLRWFVADYEYPRLKYPFLQYIYQPMAIIDIVSILPGVLVSITYHNPEFMTLMLLRLTRLARVLRSLKILEYSHSFRVLRAVIKNSIRPLKAVLAFTTSYIIIAALVIFHIEPGFRNFFEAGAVLGDRFPDDNRIWRPGPDDDAWQDRDHGVFNHGRRSDRAAFRYRYGGIYESSRR